ncbi:DUF397 domain-containing protein [Streptomyces sp. NPDC059255]|uniref:DUF397 domain-containing protein n=1 Tax=Streptomyces sp. NPDC059255 TaxID=3346793 RepID=UPI0036A0731C
MNKVDLTGAVWIKSSRSNGQSACVETAFVGQDIVPVRDSKVARGPVLVFGADMWSAFVAGVKRGALHAGD